MKGQQAAFVVVGRVCVCMLKNQRQGEHTLSKAL